MENSQSIINIDNTANPAPLGLLAFGMTTVLLNLHNAGLYPIGSMILAMGIFYGGIGQIIAGVMEWKKKQHFWNHGLYLIWYFLVNPCWSDSHAKAWVGRSSGVDSHGVLSVNLGMLYCHDVCWYA